MTTTTGIGLHDQNLEKQIEKTMGGCMAGFFNLFDRSHLLSARRLHPKRLPPSLSSSVVGDSASEPVSTVGSPAISMEFEKPQPPSPAPEKSDLRSPAPKSPVSVSTFEFKEGVVKSPWKFNREAPRLSLDSRAVVDAKGSLLRINTTANTTAIAAGDEERENQRRSPSVIARLMGLEPPAPSSSESEPEKKVELRRSASESRSRDYHRFFDTPSFLSPPINRHETVGGGERKSDQSAVNRAQSSSISNNGGVRREKMNQKNNQQQQRRLMVERKSYYDTADFFPPEMKQNHHQAVTIYGEIERRLRMRGIDEPSKDLETLKHILEALQLKGLLHNSNTTTTRHNVVYDRRFSGEDESPIVLMKPARSPAPANRRRVNEPSVSPRRERAARSPTRSPAPAVRRKGGPLRVETQRRGNETTTTAVRGSHSPVQSPRTTTATRRGDQTVKRGARNRRSTVENCQGERGILSGPPLPLAEDEASTVSESSFMSSSSHTDNERWRGEEYREGRNLLERCDKLLHSIAEMTATSNSNSNSAELQQPSPVSVLDSSFYKEDESSPSPVKKRTIHFKDQVVMELEDELWTPSPSSSSTQLLLSNLDHHQDMDSSDDSDFSYVSEVFRASAYLSEDTTNLFLLLEKQSSIRGKSDQSKSSILQRKLIFDTIFEILDRTRQLPPWKAVSIGNFASGKPTLGHIWSEFLKIREVGPSEDLFEVICKVLKKDLAGDSINGWIDCPIEMSEAVLDIERLIFKDLIGETIQDLAAFARKSMPRRKLVF